MPNTAATTNASEPATRAENLTRLKQLIDQHTLSGVCQMISEICCQKERHIETFWQDHSLAKKWRAAELWFDKLHVNLDI